MPHFLAATACLLASPSAGGIHPSISARRSLALALLASLRVEAPGDKMSKAGDAQGSTTERCLHATRTAYSDAADLAEARLFG